MADLWLIVGVSVFINCGWCLIYKWFLLPTIDRFEKDFDAACDRLEARIVEANAERDAALTEVERLKAERDEFDRLYRNAMAGEHWYEDQCDRVERAVYEHLKSVGRPLHPHHNYGDAMDALPGELEMLRKERGAP